MKLYVSVTFKKCGNVGFRPVITYNGLAGSDKDFFVLTPLQDQPKPLKELIQ